ncbi:unnamed protein product [Brachionus calyciflorus]|uniref:Uncharacterized protein n=1 Tax=Brachionus calyciflorus TaxID=104777 RepID=A0A814Q5K2_9BILA|nr:unnamed protein product [Brachionus calyciflorus]
MPVSMHKLLVHSSQIIPNFDLPIGFFSGEALEARNKDNKYIRLFHTRKINRVTTITDQFNRLLVTSEFNISTVCRSFHQDIAESEDEEEDEIEEEIEKSVDINNNEMEIDDDETDKHHVFEILLKAETIIISDIANSDFYDDN